MSRVRNYCVIINNYKDNDLELLQSIKCIKYAIFGKEIGKKKGTPHLQGYVQLHNAKTMTALHKVLQESKVTKCALKAARGDWQSNHEYCTKDADVTEWGEPKKQGKRIDIDALYADVKEGHSDFYLQENHTKAYMRYYKAVDRIRQNFKQEDARVKLIEEFPLEGTTLRKWQKATLKDLEEQSTRQIKWIYDNKGNSGKTWLAKFLMRDRDAFYVRGGKTQDIAYAYNYEKYVVFDFTRSQEEFINYSTIECFKDGTIFSSKYQSILKKFPACTVLCLSNFYPDTSKLSQDRWDITDLSSV